MASLNHCLKHALPPCFRIQWSANSNSQHSHHQSALLLFSISLLSLVSCSFLPSRFTSFPELISSLFPPHLFPFTWSVLPLVKSALILTLLPFLFWPFRACFYHFLWARLLSAGDEWFLLFCRIIKTNTTNWRWFIVASTATHTIMQTGTNQRTVFRSEADWNHE